MIDTGFDDARPPDQGNVLRAVRTGVDVVLDFRGAAATAWRLYRDVDKRSLGATALPPDARTPRFLDPAAVPATEIDVYRRALSPCSLTPGP